MAEYKVIFRDEKPDWQENCPILLEAVQVSRDTQSSATYLQLKVRNISDSSIDSIAIEAIITSPDGKSETLQIESLDADIVPNAIFRPNAVRLANSEIETVSAQVTRADADRAFREAISIPDAQALTLSAQARIERNQQLSSMGYTPEKMSYLHYEGDGWWICSCGALNIMDSKCRECGIKRAQLANLENEALLEEQAAERKYLDASKALAGSSVAALEKAKKAFEELGEYKDSASLMGQCDELINSLKKGRSRKTKIAISIAIAIAVVVAIVVLAVTVLIPSARIDEAMKKAEGGDYDGAITMLKKYGETEKVAEVNRMKATAAAEHGEYETAVRIYKDLDDGDAAKQVHKQWADSLFAEGKYDDALNHYRDASDDAGVFECAAKFSESGDYSKAISVLEPLLSKGYDGAENAMNEAKYGYITANYYNTDETTCKYLLELKGKGYKDTQALCDSLYVLSATSRGFENKPVKKYNNVTFNYTIDGCMPGGLDDRTVSVYDSIHNETKQRPLKYGGNRSLLMSQLIDGGAHSATIRITDDSTGAVLLEETISF